jgi:hypothetical protein
VKNNLKQYVPEEIESEEIFDPDYHEDYFDVDEVDEYGVDDDNSESNYLNRDLWDEEDFDSFEEWFEE